MLTSVPAAPAPATTLLKIDNVRVVYDQIVLAVDGASIDVQAGAIIALIGANGAGKSSILKAVSGLVRAERGKVITGSITFNGSRIDRLAADAIVRKGCVQVLEGRRCFAALSIEENLLSGSFSIPAGRAAIRRNLDRIYEFFPCLHERRRTPAGLTSGGEQQMCAIGRALMAEPKLLLLDEPSMGLAPQIVEGIFALLKRLNTEDGLSLLIAEQNTTAALRYADHGYVIESGRVVMQSSAAELRANDDVKKFYLGGGRVESFRPARIVAQ